MEVILSAAVSLDGYLDDATPARLKLSGPEDWAAVAELRAKCDAILVGANTVRRDNPSLVVRDPALRRRRTVAGLPGDIAKVTLTSSGDLDPHAAFFTEGAGPKLVFAPTTANVGNLSDPAEIITADHITASFITHTLASRGIGRLMVEGGARVLAMFLDEGAADRLRLAVAPFFVGAGVHFPDIEPRRMKLESVERLGETAILNYTRND